MVTARVIGIVHSKSDDKSPYLRRLGLCVRDRDVAGFLEIGLIKFSLKRTAIFHIEPSR